MPLPPQRLSRIWRIAQLEARLNGMQKGRLCSPLVTAIFTPILDALSMSTNYGLIFGAAQLGLFAEKPLTRDGLSFSFRTGKTVALVSTSGGNRSTAARLLLLMEVIAGLKKGSAVGLSRAEPCLCVLRLPARAQRMPHRRVGDAQGHLHPRRCWRRCSACVRTCCRWRRVSPTSSTGAASGEREDRAGLRGRGLSEAIVFTKLPLRAGINFAIAQFDACRIEHALARRNLHILRLPCPIYACGGIDEMYRYRVRMV